MTQTLLHSSIARAEAEGALPAVAGANPREKLLNARSAARAALENHVGNLSFDEQAASLVMSQVGGWIERNSHELEQAMREPAATLPRSLCISMGSAKQVQDWILALFTIAAAGTGPWQSGQVERAALDPDSSVSPLWAAADARDRTNILRAIMGMEQSGELESIFNPAPGAGPQDPCGASGLAGPPAAIVAAIIISATLFASVVVFCYFDGKKSERNNATMRELCARAQAECHAGNAAACAESAACIEALEAIGVGGPGLAKELGRAALAVGGGYLLLVYGVPWVLASLGVQTARGKKGAS